MNSTMKSSQESTIHLDLPMTTFFSVKASPERAVAHALDFDLVAVSTSPERALAKLRAAVKQHIEFGFARGLKDADIRMSAPPECWHKLAGASVMLGEDIEVDHQRIRTLTQTVHAPTVIDETRSSLTAA